MHNRSKGCSRWCGQRVSTIAIAISQTVKGWLVASGPNQCGEWLCVHTCGFARQIANNLLTNSRVAIPCRKCCDQYNEQRALQQALHEAKRLLRAIARCNLPSQLYRRLGTVAGNAIKRCYDESHLSYRNYGVRGIRVHIDWLAEPKQFVAYLATLPGHDDPTLVLDRIDNSGHYEPGNLRFITRIESNKNRRKYTRRTVQPPSVFAKMRQAVGLTQYEVAIQTSTPQSTIASFELGHLRTQTICDRLANFYSSLESPL